MKRHVVTQPAFDPAAFVIIAPGALHSILITALKSIDIELAHIVPDPFKALDQLTISHMIFLDYRECGPHGEPKVVHIDQEGNYEITPLADSFEDFIRGLVNEDDFELED